MRLTKYYIFSEEISAGQKDYSISFARLIATIFIFLCHFFQYYCNGLTYFFNVAVQMFFFLSGLLYANRKIEDPIAFLKKGAKKILVPYYIYVVIACIIGRIFIPEDCTWHIVVKLLLLDAEGSYTALNNLWFISHILFCYLMAPLFLKWITYIEEHKGLLYYMMIFCTLLGILVFFYKYASYYKPWDTLCYFIGILYGRLAMRKENVLIAIWNIILVGGTLLLKGFLKFTDQHMDYIYAHDLAGLQYQLYKMSHAFMGITFVIICVFIYKVIFQSKSNRLVEIFLGWSDKYSYFIYLTHQIFMLGAFSLCAYIVSKKVAMLVILACTLIAAWCLQRMSQVLLGWMRTVELKRE